MMARPMPRAAPVTRQRLPLKSYLMLMVGEEECWRGIASRNLSTGRHVDDTHLLAGRGRQPKLKLNHQHHGRQHA